MNSTEEEEPASLRRLKALQELGESDFRLWSFYEERAERLGAQLWTIGTWMIAAVMAAMSAPFLAKFVVPKAASFPFLEVYARVPTALISVFGMLLCIYATAALQDIRDHIESNWRKAGYILEGTWQANWGGRKGHGWRVLQVVGVLAEAGFAALLVLAVLG